MNSRLLELALRIADDAARGILLAEMIPSPDEPEWMDLTGVPEEADERLQEAIEYLELRGMLVSKAGKRLVRFIENGLPN